MSPEFFGLLQMDYRILLDALLNLQLYESMCHHHLISQQH